jgi:hypothetical protein
VLCELARLHSAAAAAVMDHISSPAADLGSTCAVTVKQAYDGWIKACAREPRLHVGNSSRNTLL